eukprot:16442874-Heterocapsa_arctica.AAC.1
MKLQKSVFEQHGYREGCRGCNAVRRSAQGIPHTPACTSRMEAAMAATPAGADRVRQLAERIGAH